MSGRLWRQLAGRKDGLILLPGEIKLTVKTAVMLLPIHFPQKSPAFFTVVIWCLWLAPTFTRLLSNQAELSLRLGSGEWLWEQFPSKTTNSICFPPPLPAGSHYGTNSGNICTTPGCVTAGNGVIVNYCCRGEASCVGTEPESEIIQSLRLK